MTKQWTIILPLALSASAMSLGGCHKSSDATEKKADTTSETASEEKKESRPKPPPIDEGIDVPTEEDFEETASTQITDTTDLNKELDQLEKEIGK
jgi:PBP1b-binding outer membrane lipoprotein LpoB